MGNPAYKGEWNPKQIDNPAFEKDIQLASYENLAYVGYELWIVNNGTIFDNILVTDDIEYAKAQGEKLVKEKWDKENKPADDLGEDDEDGEGDDEDEEEEEMDREMSGVEHSRARKRYCECSSAGFVSKPLFK